MALAEIRKEIEQRFDKKLAEIQDTSLKFGDVFIAGKAYRPNTFAVSKGSLWLSRAETIDPPGSSTSWQLVCKQGAFDKPRALMSPETSKLRPERFATAIIGIGEKAQLEAIDRLFNALIQDGCPPWALAQFGRTMIGEYRRASYPAAQRYPPMTHKAREHRGVRPTDQVEAPTPAAPAAQGPGQPEAQCPLPAARPVGEVIAHAQRISPRRPRQQAQLSLDRSRAQRAEARNSSGDRAF